MHLHVCAFGDAGFVRLLNAVPGGLVNVLDAKRRKIEEAAA